MCKSRAMCRSGNSSIAYRLSISRSNYYGYSKQCFSFHKEICGKQIYGLFRDHYFSPFVFIPGADFIRVHSKPEVVIGAGQESSEHEDIRNTFLLVRVQKYRLYQKQLLFSVLRWNTEPKCPRIQLNWLPLLTPALKKARMNPGISDFPGNLKQNLERRPKETI
jgi:hypothetical protein